MDLPLLTASLAGTGGILRVSPEDFEVEELPAYLPRGEGEHLYLWVEKRGLSTPDAARALARHAGLRERDVGYAGLKDKRARTRQFFSLCLRDDARFSGFEAPGLRVLSVARHANKLRTGHLRGNRFAIRVRGAVPEAAERARAVLGVLGQKGVPNAYGPQRFGREGSTAQLGRALLLDAPHPDRARAGRDRFLRRLALSAFQSALFNRLLARRLGEGSWASALEGDVLQKPTGAAFVCEDPATEQVRLDAFELSVAGPMFGPRLLATRGAAREREQAVLEEAGVAESVFEKGGKLTEGARRPLRVQLESPEVEPVEDGIVVRFGLPRGAYASVVMAEVTKAEAAVDVEGD